MTVLFLFVVLEGEVGVGGLGLEGRLCLAKEVCRLNVFEDTSLVSQYQRSSAHGTCWR